MQEDKKPQNIVKLAQGCPPETFREVTRMTAYWSALRKQGQIPRRSEVDPRGIESALEYAFVAEKVAPGLARFRIAGTHLTDLMGMEVRGMPLSALIAPEHRATLSEFLVEVFDAPAMARTDLQSENGIGKPGLAAQLLLLPLRSDLGDVSRILGCLVSKGPIGRAPRRFEITRSTVTRIESPAAAPVPVPLERAPTPPVVHRSERPYLRLVKS